MDFGRDWCASLALCQSLSLFCAIQTGSATECEIIRRSNSSRKTMDGHA